MQLSSKYVGSRSRALDIELTARQTMNYAAAVADSNPAYFDDERPGGILAPPMLSVALTWPLSERFHAYWDTEGFPLEILARQVHYSEHIEWHRPMKPGDHLRIEGEIKAIVPHPAGVHLVLHYTAAAPDKSVVFEEYIGALLRGVQCADEGQGAGQIPARHCALPAPPHFEAPDHPLWQKAVHIDPLAAHIYDGCSGIFFPIHTSRAFARAVGLPGTVYQGTGTLAQALREIVNTEAGADPRRLKAVSCIFGAMVPLDSDLTVSVLGRMKSDDGTDLFFNVLNHEGKQALRKGYVRLCA